MRVEGPAFQTARDMLFAERRLALARKISKLVYDGITITDTDNFTKPQTKHQHVIVRRLRGLSEDVESASIDLEAVIECSGLAYQAEASSGRSTKESVRGVINGVEIDVRRISRLGSLMRKFQGTMCGREIEEGRARALWNIYGIITKQVQERAETIDARK